MAWRDQNSLGPVWHRVGRPLEQNCRSVLSGRIWVEAVDEQWKEAGRRDIWLGVRATKSLAFITFHHLSAYLSRLNPPFFSSLLDARRDLCRDRSAFELFFSPFFPTFHAKRKVDIGVALIFFFLHSPHLLAIVGKGKLLDSVFLLVPCAGAAPNG